MSSEHTQVESVMNTPSISRQSTLLRYPAWNLLLAVVDPDVLRMFFGKTDLPNTVALTGTPNISASAMTCCCNKAVHLGTQE
jgi:hypothetical protein